MLQIAGKADRTGNQQIPIIPKTILDLNWSPAFKIGSVPPGPWAHTGLCLSYRIETRARPVDQVCTNLAPGKVDVFDAYIFIIISYIYIILYILYNHLIYCDKYIYMIQLDTCKLLRNKTYYIYIFKDPSICQLIWYDTQYRSLYINTSLHYMYNMCIYIYNTHTYIYIMYISIYIHTSDHQYPRRRVLYTRIVGLCCCHFVVHFAWEVQESARVGARYISN